jgi:hypothetical protein
MPDLPVVAPIVPPVPPALPPSPAPPAASGAAPAFVPASGDRDILYDAFYVDERNTTIAKSSHPIKSFYNTYTKFNGPPGYGSAAALTASKTFTNPLRDPAVATILTQDLAKLGATAASTKQHFEEVRPYYVFAPLRLRDAHKAKARGNPADMPKAKVALFFDVEPEINLFGLRSFFSATADCVLVTIPGVEAGWTGYGRAWGIGITTDMIRQLLAVAGLADIDFTIEVMAGYSTGYRGMNETIINRLVQLDALKRIVYLDAFYHHTDFPIAPPSSPYFKRNTVWAVETVLGAVASAQVLIYGYTTGGTPRADGKGTLRGPFASLRNTYASRIRLIDLEFKQGGVPSIAEQVEKICLARLIQGGIDDYFERKDVRADILALVDIVPDRGAFGTFGRSGFIDLYKWITAAPQRAVIRGFPHDKAFAMVTKFRLLAGWTAGGWYEFRHRDFVQEVGKECILP